MKLVLIGARPDGQGSHALDVIRDGTQHEVVAFLDDTPELQGTAVDGVPVVGTSSDLARAVELGARGAMISIGDGRARLQLGARLVDAGLEPFTFVHPRAYVSTTATVGRGVFLGTNVVVSTHVVVGDHALIYSGCVVGHHSHVEPGATLSAGVLLGGRARIGAGAFVGLGATVSEDVTIGPDAVVGASAAVIRDVPAGARVAGVPARDLRR